MRPAVELVDLVKPMVIPSVGGHPTIHAGPE